jgi:hypothetical protein
MMLHIGKSLLDDELKVWDYLKNGTIFEGRKKSY